MLISWVVAEASIIAVGVKYVTAVSSYGSHPHLPTVVISDGCKALVPLVQVYCLSGAMAGRKVTKPD